MLVTAHLKKLGYSSQAVANGREVLEELERGNFDLILMDCQMPEMDGYEATREIRKREAGTGRHIPIVALTANALHEDIAICLKAGMDAHISKPIRREALAEGIEVALKAVRKRDAA